MIRKIGGWGNFTLLCLLIGVLAYGYLHKRARVNNASYTKGISEGLKKGVRGSISLHYNFNVNNNWFEGSVPSEFCKECNCCGVGDTVFVRFQTNNPQNNDLVSKLPAGVKFY